MRRFLSHDYRRPTARTWQLRGPAPCAPKSRNLSILCAVQAPERRDSRGHKIPTGARTRGSAFHLPVDTSGSATAEPNAPAFRRRRWLVLSGDLWGGFAAALIAIPHAMTLGVLAFAALGPAYAS